MSNAGTKEKQRRQRQAMIEEAIKLGVFDDRRHFKSWMKSEFNLKQPVEEISTEYTLTEKQTNLLYVWLKHFTGRGPKPTVHRAKSRLSEAQEMKIDALFEELEYTPSQQADFIHQQVGERKLITSLFRKEATKVITGLQRIQKEKAHA